ncbi:MFS transporter [Paenibacillus cisolokensis]|uniref:MFS transporter n=1 Tax=Paenibacillus cisolokensis TaxID=1658519 RepID=A0ABQ4ND18_9BACL|nr:MFS transporter [Paenibacillus cisolokensis]GIQ66111.1 MFS transporter [Paenibacillus cisolokensis]
MEVAAEKPNREKLLLILAFTLVISVMNATMFNIALPEIRAEFALSVSQVSWVTSAYLLIYAIGTVIYGKLADIYKLKHLVAVGLAVFALGSVVGLAAEAYWSVLLGRILQAAGAAVIPATASIIPVKYFPAETRGRALGITMTGLAIGSAIGPVAAALAISFVHWRWLFILPMFTLIAIPFYRKNLDDNRQAGEERIDWLGGGLLAGTVAFLLIAITGGGWAFIPGCLLLVLFAIRIRSAPEPFIRPGLFRNKGYSTGLAIAFLSTGIGYSLVFLSPQLLTDVNRLAPGLVGFVMVPAAVATAILGRHGGKMADTKGNTFLFCTAAASLLTCFVLMSSFATVSPVLVSIFLIFGNVGLSFMLIALSNAISRMVPKEQSGVGMGLLSMLNFMSGAVATGVYSRIVDQGAAAVWNPLSAHTPAPVYSNLYLVLALLVVILMLLYYRLLGGKTK